VILREGYSSSVALLPAHGLAPLAPRLAACASLDRGLFVVRAALHLLEQASFCIRFLRALKRRLDLIFDDLDSHAGFRVPHFGGDSQPFNLLSSRP